MAANTFQVDDDRYRSEGPPRKRSPWFTCAIGCLVVLVVVVVLVVLASVWFYRNMKTLAVAGISEAVKLEINETELSPQEKAQVKTEIERVRQAAEDGQLSTEQAIQLMEVAMESPLVDVIATSAAEQKLIDKSNLSDDEKAEARQILRRFLSGSLDGDISRNEFNDAVSSIANKIESGRLQLRKNVSDEQLKAFVEAARKAADDANVPEQPDPFDPSDAVKRIIDEALMVPAGEPADEAPVDEPAAIEEPADEEPAEEEPVDGPPANEEPADDGPAA
jgi:hypothetical protein